MSSRNAWLLYDSLCVSKLIYASAVWWPSWLDSSSAAKAYRRSVNDHFRGVLKFITGSYVDQSAVCFEHHYMCLADKLSSHLLNTRIRWATQLQSRTSYKVAQASPRLRRIIGDLDSHFSTNVSHLLIASPDLVTLRQRLTTAGIEVHRIEDNRHQLSRDSDPRRCAAVSIRRAMRTFISDRIFKSLRSALTHTLSTRAESHPAAQKNWHAYPLHTFTDWSSNSSGPLAYLQVPHRTPRVNLGLQIKQRLRVGDPFRGTGRCPAPSCSDHSENENHTHFLLCPARSFLAKQLLTQLHSLAAASTKEDCATIQLYLSKLALTSVDQPDQTSAPISPFFFLALVYAACPSSLCSAFCLPSTARLPLPIFFSFSSSIAVFLARSWLLRSKTIQPAQAQTPMKNPDSDNKRQRLLTTFFPLSAAPPVPRVRDGRGLSSGSVLRDGDQGSPVEGESGAGPSPRKRSRRSGAVDAVAVGESADCRQLLCFGEISGSPPAGARALGPLGGPDR